MLSVAIRQQLGAFSLDVAFEHHGGILILFGRSGAGKTSALRAIAGLQSPDTGKITLNSALLFDQSSGTHVPPWRRQIGYVFQQPNLFPHLTGYANARYATSANDERIDRWVDAFDVRHVMNRYPRHMSGGERQRVALVRALASNPYLLLLDEPMSGVDLGTRELLMSAIRDLQRESAVPIVYVTHQTSEAYRLGNRVIVLERGRIVQDGRPIDVLQTPTSIAVASLSGLENLMQCRIVAHSAADHVTTVDARGVTFQTPLSPGAAGDEITVAIRPEDILVATRDISGTSARNRVTGLVTEVAEDAFPSIVVELNPGLTLRARLTRKSIRELNIEPGARVHLLMKAWAFHRVDLDASASTQVDTQRH